MAMQGAATLCMYDPCTWAPPFNLNVPFTAGGVSGVGLGGQVVATTVSGQVNITVNGAPWAQTAAIGANVVSGFVHGPASGGQSSAAAVSGVVSLVTPIFISTDHYYFPPAIPAFGFLTLHFVPEPGTLLLLGAGVTGLGILGRKRMSK
jgi:hypothetical protein